MKSVSFVKVVSLDLDGTLTTPSFVDAVWLEEIPRLYAIKNNLSIDHAKIIVKGEYQKIGKERLEWYDLSYWIQKFRLDVNTNTLLNKFRSRVTLYPDVPKALQWLREKTYPIVLLTNAHREFHRLELKEANIAKYFKYIFSATSDFGMVKSQTAVYRKLCDYLKIAPHELLHVGNDRYLDFIIPRKLGILTYLLDRSNKEKGRHVIYSLTELKKNLEK